MKLDGKITALERASTTPAKLCCVTYKANQGPAGEIRLSMDKALQEARTGRVKEIHFPLTFNEEQAERLYARDELERWLSDYRAGINRDLYKSAADRLILCTKPVVFARQAPPRGRIGGYFITEDGTPFHQTQWQEILSQYGAGFIIVRDYDESKEPWHKERS